jgi:hypothetical protein
VTTETSTTENSAIDQARAEVDRLLQAEKDILSRYMEIRQQLPTVREAAGDAILSDLLGGKAVHKGNSQLVAIEGDLEALCAAEMAAQRQRIEAIKKVWSLEAQAQRDKASSLRDEADALDSEARPLIDALAEIWGCQPVTPVLRRADGVAMGGTFHAHTRAEALRNEARGLEHNAGQREMQKVSRNGHTEAGSIDELTAYLHSNPLHVGCPAIEVVAWAEKAKTGEEDRRAKFNPRPAEWPAMVYVLHYQDGVIDERQSRVYTPAPM